MTLLPGGGRRKAAWMRQLQRIGVPVIIGRSGSRSTPPSRQASGRSRRGRGANDRPRRHTPGRRNELLKQELTEYEQRHREDTLWVQRVYTAIYVAAVVSGGVLVVGYAATSRWVHAAVCVLLVGMGVLAEEAPKARGLSAVTFAGLVTLAMLLVSRGASASSP